MGMDIGMGMGRAWARHAGDRNRAMAGLRQNMPGEWVRHGQGMDGAWVVLGQGMSRAWAGDCLDQGRKCAGGGQGVGSGWAWAWAWASAWALA